MERKEQEKKDKEEQDAREKSQMEKEDRENGERPKSTKKSKKSKKSSGKAREEPLPSIEEDDFSDPNSGSDSSSDSDSDSDSDSSEDEPDARSISMGTPHPPVEGDPTILQLRAHPNGRRGVCSMNIDCIMPRGQIRVSQPGRNPGTEVAYLIKARAYPAAKQNFLRTGGSQMSSRDAAVLIGVEPCHVRVKNIAIDGNSVSRMSDGFMN
ncbi:hypothetical protein ACHAO7_011512 [Fusarium culmorum]